MDINWSLKHEKNYNSGANGLKEDGIKLAPFWRRTLLVNNYITQPKKPASSAKTQTIVSHQFLTLQHEHDTCNKKNVCQEINYSSSYGILGSYGEQNTLTKALKMKQ